jgi:hypothetical protein
MKLHSKGRLLALPAYIKFTVNVKRSSLLSKGDNYSCRDFYKTGACTIKHYGVVIYGKRTDFVVS